MAVDAIARKKTRCIRTFPTDVRSADSVRYRAARVRERYAGHYIKMTSGPERLPYLATQAAAPYEGIRPIPVAVLLDNIRSLYNVGAFFRTADAAGCEKLHLCGITGRPPERAIAKTALGAEETVPWEHPPDACEGGRRFRSATDEIAACESHLHAVHLFDWQPLFPTVILFVHPVEGLNPGLLELCDTHVRIP